MNASTLKLQLESYLGLRRALGYSLQAEQRLWDFLEFVRSRNWTSPITAQLAVEWACSSPGCGPAGQARRLSVVRGFLAHVRASYPETEIPGQRLLAATHRRNPYIYSQPEIEQLLQAARKLRPYGSLRPLTYSTLIGLLVSSGLRPSEALRLTIDDVRLETEPPLLLVFHTKFRKSRIVPIHPTTANMLWTYLRQRKNHCSGKAFFVSQQRNLLNPNVAWRTFDTLRRQVGIKTTPDGRRPTLHALRHTFAVNRLVAWYKEGVDIRAWIPRLSVYLGHVEPKDTYWYLTATPELLRTVADSFDIYADGGGIP
jgi:integrase